VAVSAVVMNSSLRGIPYFPRCCIAHAAIINRSPAKEMKCTPLTEQAESVETELHLITVFVCLITVDTELLTFNLLVH
jgi:hypothetical protein